MDERQRQHPATASPTPYREQEQAHGSASSSFFGNVPVVIQDDDLRWWAWDKAREAWLAFLFNKTGRTHTTEAYGSAVAQFFWWAENVFGDGQSVMPWSVSPVMAIEWNNWLYAEGKKVASKPDTDGQSPWEQGTASEAHLPDWMRWQAPDGRIIARRVKRDDEQQIVAVEISERGPLAISSVNQKLAALTSLYKFVIAYTAVGPSGRVISIWDRERANPFGSVPRNKPSNDRAVYPTLAELKAIISSINTDCLRGKRDYALLYTYAQTCRRASELIELKWGDIRDLGDGRYTYTYNIRKKGRDQRQCDELDRACYHAICNYLRADGRLEEIEDDDYIFVAFDSVRIQRLNPNAPIDEKRHLDPNTVNKTFKALARRAGVDERCAHLHALRHLGARLRWEQQLAGGKPDPFALMKVLHHKDLATTMIYIQDHLSDPSDPGGRAAADELMPKGKKKRLRKKAAPEQGRLL